MEYPIQKQMCDNMALRILVAEDDKELADTYKMALENRGHTVTTARDRVECLQTCSDLLKNKDNETQSLFDVVILDQQMPSMDGIDMANEIQKVNPKQRIIFITGYGTEVIEKLRGLRVEVMNKSLTLKTLIIQIEGWSLFTWRGNAKHGFKDRDGYSGTSVPVCPSRST
ncbi:MAG: response regulator [Patescibacteria group bacterium]|nr:response regulator [Patescibacteria group bacterium]